MTTHCRRLRGLRIGMRSFLSCHTSMRWKSNILRIAIGLLIVLPPCRSTVADELTLGYFGSKAEHAQLQKSLATFDRAHVKVVKYQFNKTDEQRPDVFLFAATDSPKLVGHVIPPALSRDNFHDKPWQSVLVNGKPIATPWFCMVKVMYANTAAFAEAGLNRPSPDAWDWPAFLRAAKAMTKPDGSQFGYMALSDQYSEDQDWIVLAGGRWSPNMYYHPRTLDQSAEAMRFASDLSYRHHVAPSAAQWSRDFLDKRTHPDFRHTPYFATGRFAMFKGSTYHLFELTQLDVKGDWHVLPLPKHRRPSSLMHVFGLAVSRDCQQVETAAALMQHLIHHPERGLPAVADADTWQRFIATHDLAHRNAPALRHIFKTSVLPEPGNRDPRLSESSIRAKPWHMKKQLWTDEVDAAYREVILSFGGGAED